MSPRDWLDQIGQLCAGATPGPWRADDEHGDLGPGASRAWTVSAAHPDGSWSHDLAYLSEDAADPVGAQEIADATFMASARTSLPQALAALRAVLDLCDQYADKGAASVPDGMTLSGLVPLESCIPADAVRAALAAAVGGDTE